MHLPQLAAVWWLCLEMYIRLLRSYRIVEWLPLVVAVSDPVDLVISQLKVPVTILSALFCLLMLKVVYPMLSLMIIFLSLF
jgi:hypothetical protein